MACCLDEFAGLIAMLTSVPQPILALVAFRFVDSFEWLLPIGLAFAAGAMIYVSLHELMDEAVEHLGKRRTIAQARHEHSRCATHTLMRSSSGVAYFACQGRGHCLCVLGQVVCREPRYLGKAPRLSSREKVACLPFEP
eukprot:4380736-Amphidinium_carterae.1